MEMSNLVCVSGKLGEDSIACIKFEIRLELARPYSVIIILINSTLDFEIDFHAAQLECACTIDLLGKRILGVSFLLFTKNQKSVSY